MRFSAKKPTTLILCLVLTAWIFFLRWPSFDRLAWNLDEGIHASIARTILDGGVMYRDAIDQRTPLTYYLVAGAFGLFGKNNMWALHALLAGMIVLTALGLFLIGRRWRNSAAGIWAALIFCALSTNLFYIGDSYSLSTEWFVIFFTTWSTWWFWCTWEKKSFWLSAVGGIGFAAAFLSKQTGLLEFGAPLATLVYLAASGRLRGIEATRQLAGLCTGFIAATALVFIYFRAQGALDDFYFYAWSYNLVYYGPETTATDRVMAALEGLRSIWEHYPVIGVALVAGVLARAINLGQKRPSEEEKNQNPAAFHLLIWALLSWAAAASAGRTYGHYYLQFMPAFALLAGCLLADWQAWWLTSRSILLKIFLSLALAASAWTVVAGPLRGPWPASLSPEYGSDAATFIHDHSKPADKIFVWGYCPDFYLIADRRPASRYIYCSFLTGLIPWTNIQPGRDTSYAIVPHTMDILLRELETNRPEYFVDTSLGEARHFTKYPLGKFPRLAKWVTANYLEVEPARFRPHGFRVLRLTDNARRTSLPLIGGIPDGKLAEPYLSGPGTTEPVAVEYEAKASHPDGSLQRMELLIDDETVDTLSFESMKDLTVKFLVHFEKMKHGQHQLKIRATSASGESRTGAPLLVENSPESLPPEQRAAFALPLVISGPTPVRLVAPFGAEGREEAGALVFFAHAPSLITYPIPAGSTRLRGRFGFRPGAYAETNNGRTDGAEFVITWINAKGQRTELFRRLLQPWEEPTDRGEHPFDLALVPTTTDGKLELEINSGPNNNSASDWTYWSDLLLSTSR